MVDVIIISFNDADRLKQAVESVLAQNAFHVIDTILIVDDGSTDHTRDVITKLAERSGKIRYFYQDNAGPAAARNTGLSNSNAEYLAFLDSDDIWHSAKIGAQIEVAQSNPDVDLIYTNVMTFEDTWPASHVTKIQSRSYYGKENIKRFFIYDGPIYPSTVLIQRKILSRSGLFDPSLRRAEETEFWYRVFCVGFVWHLNEHLAYKRISKNSLSSDMEIMAPFVIMGANKFISMHPEIAPLLKKKEAELSFTIAKDKLFYKKKRREARFFLTKSLSLNPWNVNVLVVLLASLIPFLNDSHLLHRLKALYKKVTFK
jgi:glycosyltransferase involved in cell wall biosynthesis